MATTQQITGALKAAGFSARKFDRYTRTTRDGFRVMKLNRTMVGILTGSTYTVPQIEAALKAAGFNTAVGRPGTADDSVFAS